MTWHELELGGYQTHHAKSVEPKYIYIYIYKILPQKIAIAIATVQGLWVELGHRKTYSYLFNDVQTTILQPILSRTIYKLHLLFSPHSNSEQQYIYTTT